MAINDDVYAALSAYPQTTLPERMYAYLGDQGYVGAMGDRLAKGGGWANVIGTLLGNTFSPGLWNHALAAVSGGSQILGENRYRIYSAAGAISQVTVPGVLTSGRAYTFTMTFETPVLGTQVQVGDAGANVDDFVSSLSGTRSVSFVADGTVATIKRPFVVSSGIPTDVVVKNVSVVDITASALSVVSQPQPQTIAAGATATFSVSVLAPFTAIHYSWEVSTNGGSSWAPYSGGTGAITNTLTTAAMATGDNGKLFRCRIRMGNSSNATGQIYSDPALLTVSSVLSGGDATLGWSTTSLSDGSEITISTDGTYNFGATPTSMAQLGFGAGWLYNSPLLTVAVDNTSMDGIIASEGGARRVESVDGVRALASRLLDASGWAGNQNAGRNLSWDINGFNTGDKIAAFQSYKMVSPTTPLNWQIKTVRGQASPTGTDGPNEFACFGWKTGPTFTVSDGASNRTSLYNTVQPHANYGWQSFAVMAQMSSPDTADGLHKTRRVAQNDTRRVQQDGGACELYDSSNAARIEYVVWQDYWDSSNGTAYEPANIDHYLTDIQVQKGSFGVVMLADGPTPVTSTNAIHIPTVMSPSIAWSVNEIKAKIWTQGRTWPVAFLHVYSGTTGDFVSSVLLWGTYVPPTYSRFTDTAGVYRKTVNSVANYIQINPITYTPASDTVVYEVGVHLASYEGYATGTQTTAVLCHGTASTTRDTLRFNVDGSLTAVSSTNVTATLVAAGGVGLGRHDLRITFSPSSIVTERWNGVAYEEIGTASRGTFTTFLPHRIFAGGSSNGFNGTAIYFGVKVNGTTVRDYRFDELSGTAIVDSSGTVADGTVSLTNGHLEWRASIS